MANCRSRLRFSRLFSATIFAASFLAFPLTAFAEIIIDDFDDDLRIEVPKQNLARVMTENVGDLNAIRSVSINGLRPIPIGFLDINQSRLSALTVEIPALTHIPQHSLLDISLIYTLTTTFDGVDLTESDKNNAVILEFGRLIADSPLSRSRVYVLAMQRHQVGSINTSSSYISTYSPLPQSSDPFSLVFPFDTFQLARGEPIADFDFSSVRELHVLIQPALLDPALPEQLNFQAELTRVRIGYVVPEPSTAVCLAVYSDMCCWRRRRCFIVHGL